MLEFTHLRVHCVADCCPSLLMTRLMSFVAMDKKQYEDDQAAMAMRSVRARSVCDNLNITASLW